MTLRSRSDGELLRRATTDAQAFEVLYQRYEAIVLTFLVRRIRDPHLAADIAAETFATALMKADRFVDTGEPALGWLLGIARNELLHALRSGRAADAMRQRLGLERVDFSDASIERVETLLDVAAITPQIREALQALPPDQREAVTAYVLDERSYESVAGVLGIPEATVRKRVSRGLARMRSTLEGLR